MTIRGFVKNINRMNAMKSEDVLDGWRFRVEGSGVQGFSACGSEPTEKLIDVTVGT